jgi:hypothetical protein
MEAAMKIEPMQNVPTSREELERNLFLLGEKIKDGKFIVGPTLSHTIDGLQRLRKLPNGRVDLLTLDEMTRLNANMIANWEQQIAPLSSDSSDGSVEESDDNPLDAQ